MGWKITPFEKQYSMALFSFAKDRLYRVSSTGLVNQLHVYLLRFYFWGCGNRLLLLSGEPCDCGQNTSLLCASVLPSLKGDDTNASICFISLWWKLLPTWTQTHKTSYRCFYGYCHFVEVTFGIVGRPRKNLSIFLLYEASDSCLHGVSSVDETRSQAMDRIMHTSHYQGSDSRAGMNEARLSWSEFCFIVSWQGSHYLLLAGRCGFPKMENRIFNPSLPYTHSFSSWHSRRWTGEQINE
jgi:hypothetical protein